MKRFTREFATSIVTVVLAIFAIAIFIYSGASALFYSTMAIALVFGFYNTWLISSLESGRQGRSRRR